MNDAATLKEISATVCRFCIVCLEMDFADQHFLLSKGRGLGRLGVAGLC